MHQVYFEQFGQRILLGDFEDLDQARAQQVQWGDEVRDRGYVTAQDGRREFVPVNATLWIGDPA